MPALVFDAADQKRYRRRKGQRVIVVSHEASRTGAPRVAIDLLASLNAAGFQTIVIHRWGGPLEAELNEMAGRIGFEPLRRIRATLRRNSRTKRFAVVVETMAARFVLFRYRPVLVWCNTSLSACYVKPCQRAGVPVVLHVHETRELCAPVLRRYGLDLPSASIAGLLFVGCSSTTADELAECTHVDRGNILVLPSSVDVAAVQAKAKAVGSNPRQLTVMACGTADFRKGVDTFTVISDVLARDADTNYRFLWIGKLTALDQDLKSGSTEFIGEVAEPIPLLAEADIVLMPSRFDPFPLAVLEAMALSKPIVAFDVGGISEQLGETGIVIAPGDTEAMITAIRDLSDNPEKRVALGRAAEARVRARWDIAVFRSEVGRIAQEAIAANQSLRGTRSDDMSV